MSRIHQALSGSDRLQNEPETDFNPLKRPGRSRNTGWWSATVLAVLATIAVLVYQSGLITTPRPQVEPEPSSSVAQTPATPQEPANRETRPAEPRSPSSDNNTLDSAPVTPESEIQTANATTDNTRGDPERETRSNPSEPATDSTPTISKKNSVAPASEKPDAPSADQPEPTAIQNQEVEEARSTATPAEPRSEATQSATPKPVAENPAAESVTLAKNRTADLEREVQNALDRGDMERAEARLRDWIGRDPDAEMPRLWLAKIYLSNQMPEAAEPLLTGLNSIEALGLRGLALEKAGRYADASRVFKALSQREPESPQWWLHWAINEENNGQLAQARVLYQTFLQEFSRYDASLTSFARGRFKALEDG